MSDDLLDLDALMEHVAAGLRAQFPGWTIQWEKSTSRWSATLLEQACEPLYGATADELRERIRSHGRVS